MRYIEELPFEKVKSLLEIKEAFAALHDGKPLDAESQA
ncbi:hypothetical protein ACVJBD_000206 [Rhizobium mongolense]